MTYETLYRPALDAYMQKWDAVCARYQLRELPDLSPAELQDEYEKHLRMLEELEASVPSEFTFDLGSALESYMEPKYSAYLQEERSIRAAYEQRRRDAEVAHDAALRRAAERAEAAVAPLTQKYDKLVSYRDAVSAAILRYDIRPSELELDVDSLTRQELEELLDTALAACEKLGEENLSAKLRILYEPAADGTTRKEQAIGIIAGALVLSPILLGVLFVHMVVNTPRVYKSADGLRVADKLMYGVNFARFREAPVLEEVPPLDCTAIDAEETAALDALADSDPQLEEHRLQTEINANLQRCSNVFLSATQEARRKHNDRLKVLNRRIQMMRALLDKYKAEQVQFGTVCNTTCVMDTKYVLGRSKGIMDVRYDVGLQNITFTNKSPDMMQFIKLCLGNALLSVRPKQLRCTIYDPEGLGADFATYMSQETADYLTVDTGDCKKLLDGARAYAQSNLRVLDQQDINTYNAEAEAAGKVTLEYRLLLLVSGVARLAEERILTEFMQFSARVGVIIWVINPTKLGNSLFYRKPFEGVEEPYPTDAALHTRIMSTYSEAFVTLKDTGILYRPAFADKYLPKEKWWTECTDKGIKLNLGLQDGDPSKGYDLMLGDGNVHGLVVGGTGSGKSVFNNQLIASLITRYPPSALELILVDFKNVEFAALTNPQTHISRIPHAKIIAGTKDGEYAISILDYMVAEMERRNTLFSSVGVKKLEEYNQLMRLRGTPEKCLPRILCIIDEFQVMFTEVDPKSVEVIQARIRSLAKLARSCGAHLLFTSQSMKGTMPKDILDQFTLRVALRCSSDTSRDIIGSDIASKIKSKFGYLYSNTNGGETQDSTRMWRTPFIPNEDLFDILEQTEAMCEKHGEKHHRAYFYDQNETHASQQLLDWLDVHAQVVTQTQRLMVLGERTSFSTKSAPVNFRLRAGDNENILYYAFEDADFYNLTMTLVDNIRANPNATLLVNCADADTHEVLDVGTWMDESLMELTQPTQDPTGWLEYLQDLVERRKALPAEERNPVYFLALRWDKQVGIGRDMRYQLLDTWNAILASAPAVGVHIVVGVRTHRSEVFSSFGSFNHIIAAKGSEDASYKFTDATVLARLPSSLGFALYRYGGENKKFKIYQHVFAKAIEEREIDV